MAVLIELLATYAPYIYAVCGLVALYQLYRLSQARANRRQAVFSLERNRAMRQLYGIFTVAMALLLTMGVTYFASSTLPRATAGAADATPDVRPMTAEEIRRDVPAQAAPILLDALTRGSVIGGWAKGDLVAFAFSLLRSERYFHPSLVSFGSFAGGSMARRIARVVAALVAEETATGRLPAMAIADSNVAAIKGCTMMGFEPLGTRWVATLR